MQMKQPSIASRAGSLAASAFFGTFGFLPTAALADQGTFWASGSYASWAAAADQPGFSFSDDYTHSRTTGSGDVARLIALRIGVLDPKVALQFSGTSRSFGAPAARAWAMRSQRLFWGDRRP
jgi:ABC-type amino acid transport substrate-binding protein